MSLYHKYRPTSLDKMLGNAQAIAALQSMLEREDLPHAYLFHGPQGCGKTTLGRIVAAHVGAVGNDLREVDAADFRGIDTIREIRKQMKLMALEGASRVWILDECHGLTSDAQRALLKALEDTPTHVYFVLCTTAPQKLLPTIRDRCAQFQMSPLNERQMLRLLRHVVDVEGESLDSEVYDQIVLDSLCHPRAALQILEQVLSVAPEARLDAAKRSAELQSEAIELCRALLKGDGWKKVASILKGIKEQEPESIRRMVLGYCQSVLLSGQTNNRAALIMEEFKDPFFNSDRPGLVLACYSVVYGEN